MISLFESAVRLHPNALCFTYVDEQGFERSYSYRETRMLAAGLATTLRQAGMKEGDCIIADLPNCPSYVFLLLACAYGSFTMVVLNHRQSESERQARARDIKSRYGLRAPLIVQEDSLRALVEHASSRLAGESVEEGKRVIMGARKDAQDNAIHFAERSAHLRDRDARALIMFTSGTMGVPKAVPLTWKQLTASAEAANRALKKQGRGLWQATLPMCHIGGLQVVVRSLCAATPFILYRKFDAARVLVDASVRKATHVSVVDKMLQDLLAADDRGRISGYQCILLGGGALNRNTLTKALKAGASVFASYGMTETASMIANSLVTPSFDGGMRLVDGYSARIVDAGPDGYGSLAVRGPSVFDGYLKNNTSFTVDGHFITGDVAKLERGRIHVRERTGDMFVSGGENIYPVEIANSILEVPGVSGAYVFGVKDATWGRRPVAFVERERDANGRPLVPVSHVKDHIRRHLERKHSRVYQPRHVVVVDELPRKGIGKVDRAAIEGAYAHRLEVKKVTLYQLRIPFVKPIVTAKSTLRARDSLIVEVEDEKGRKGLGECVSFSTDWYMPETMGEDARALQHHLAPQILNQIYLHPNEVAGALARNEKAAKLPMACGAIEPALWDLYGKIAKKPLWRLINESFGTEKDAEAGRNSSPQAVGAGAVIGICAPSKAVDAARRCVEAGYKRIKLKVAPGCGIAQATAIRQAFPDLMITLDANQSFTERDFPELRLLDALGAAWIEEPLDLKAAMATNYGSARDPFAKLAYLQRSLKTPICLDESITCKEDALRALNYPELRCYCVKIGKFGGIRPALDFVKMALSRGCTVWMGGMFETGISRRMHAAFETLPGVNIPGDIGSTAHYLATEITEPPYTAERGLITLNRGSHQTGLGCGLCYSTLVGTLVNKVVIE